MLAPAEGRSTAKPKLGQYLASIRNDRKMTLRQVEEATKTIEDAGFSVQVGAPVDSTVGAGLVATQTPGAGQVPGGTTVTLSPSTGNPPAANVPNVVGAKFSDAKKTLEDAGFSVDDKGCNGGTPVTAQNPPGGSPAPPGSTVSVVCIGNEH